MFDLLPARLQAKIRVQDTHWIWTGYSTPARPNRLKLNYDTYEPSGLKPRGRRGPNKNNPLARHDTGDYPLFVRSALAAQPRVRFQGVSVPAHRVVMMHIMRLADPKLVPKLRHDCPEPLCVHPDHWLCKSPTGWIHFKDFADAPVSIATLVAADISEFQSAESASVELGFKIPPSSWAAYVAHCRELEE